jgi:hypothetical protein
MLSSTNHKFVISTEGALLRRSGEIPASAFAVAFALAFAVALHGQISQILTTPTAQPAATTTPPL